MTEREEQAITVLNTLYNNPLLSDIHRQALEVGIMAIKALSSSENPNKWIPVSERLPEKDDLYLICFDDGEYDLVYFCKGFFSRSGVIAWMPLPDPYKQEVER